MFETKKKCVSLSNVKVIFFLLKKNTFLIFFVLKMTTPSESIPLTYNDIVGVEPFQLTMSESLMFLQALRVLWNSAKFKDVYPNIDEFFVLRPTVSKIRKYIRDTNNKSITTMMK